MRSRGLFCTALLLACGGGKSGPQPPAAPTGVSAQAGDAQVTVLWDAVSGAIGYRVYSGIGGLSAHTDAGSAPSFTLTGLTNSVTWSFAVTALGTGGESAQSATVAATPQANIPIAVVTVTPANGSTAIPRGTAVTVTFNRPAQNVTTGCSGTVRLSDDSFATCADGTFASSNVGSTWTFLPAALLHGSATYKLRVTTGVKDANGIALQTEFTSAGV